MKDKLAQVIQLRKERDAAKLKLKDKFMENKHATVAWFNAEDERIDRTYQKRLKALKTG